MSSSKTVRFDPKGKVLLLENIHETAADRFRKQGFDVESLSSSVGPAVLIEKLQGVHMVGIRSKTTITADILKEARELTSIGCFCIGTNQVDLEAASQRGIAVFNAPFGNTRSVAELILSQIICLSRQYAQRSIEVHKGTWNKKSAGCFEVRGKTLGIVGYGNIGTQLSFLAESVGMRVVFYDLVTKLPLGNSKACESLTELLTESDFVTLHVPATALTTNMISTKELNLMKRGSYLLNASRGNVVDLAALKEALRSQHLAGASIDVYPDEPEANTDSFKCALQGIDNVLLTPHIGGATEEAQSIIGKEVSLSLSRYVNSGCTMGSVNLPMVDAGPMRGKYRFLSLHKNVPGVLGDLNRIISQFSVNIEMQHLTTQGMYGVLIFETDQPLPNNAIETIAQHEASIRMMVMTPLGR